MSETYDPTPGEYDHRGIDCPEHGQNVPHRRPKGRTGPFVCVSCMSERPLESHFGMWPGDEAYEKFAATMSITPIFFPDPIVSVPTDPQERKNLPVVRGVLDYFPNAVLEVSAVSRGGNEQHNPGQEIHWARSKSQDHADCIVRHLMDRGKLDKDGFRHSAKVAWRALALLQLEIEQELGLPPSRGSK